MNSGVYFLKFSPEMYYVGKSVNIDGRIAQHIESFHKGTASSKLMAAYKKYGVPSSGTLCSCHHDHIDLVETLMIERIKPSLNTAPTAKVSRSDAEVIEANEDYLAMSTGQHIALLESRKARIQELQNRDADKIISTLLEDLMRERNKSWWRKLVG